MTNFIRMTTGTAPLAVQSATAAGSLSMADANFDGVKHHDINKVSTENQVLTSVVGIATVLGVAASLAAMWLEASLVTYIAFAFPLITGPMVLSQRRKLQWLPTFREESDKLRLSVEDLALTRAQLGIEAGRLERQVKRMSDVEQRFEHLVTREGKDVAQFRQLIREGASIQDEMKRTQASKDLLDLFTVILKSDKDEDNLVGSKEMEEFILRVRAFAGRRGKILDESVIRDAFKHSMSKRGTASMFNVVQGALSDHEDEAEPMPEKSKPDEEEVDGGFVKLQKTPRVGPTGLLVSENTHQVLNAAPASLAIPESDLVVSQSSQQVPKVGAAGLVVAPEGTQFPRGGVTDPVAVPEKPQRVPRVGATGLVVSESMEEEGNAANPIKVENLRLADDNETTVDKMEGATSGKETTPQEPTKKIEVESMDVLAMFLNSLTGTKSEESMKAEHSISTNV